jgi:ABC-type transporter Mla maintaining outer membrane lipid asymmetry ATPase subunit MlaF
MATNSEDIMLGFGNLSAIDLKSNKTVFADVTGFVKRGGLTAILGASSTGKTVLLKVRIHDR